MRALSDSIAVVGLGVSGLAVARYIYKHQGMIPISMSVYDSADNDRLRLLALELAEAGADVHLGAETVDGRFRVAVVSPGIMPKSPLRRSVQQAADRVIGEIEFAFERSVSPWLAVTGTNGKTTVTSLCVHLLTSAGVPAEAVGNIGVPPITLVDEVGPSTALVAEVSSFQLALTDAFRPRVAVLLNITPDHIDWHGSFQAYAADKAKLFANMGPDDCAVIDIDDSGSAPLAETVAARGVRVMRVSRVGLPMGGAGLVDGWLTLDTPAGPIRVLKASSLKIRGDHNVSNALAATAAVHSWGIDIDAIARGLLGFEPIKHRLEPVGVNDGVDYINDSKATNPGATIMAL
ncbi:MAG: UDP-N-acetylmuramoyl-L-alanine--D-glutamate ligase, partial [Coriobacteriia bacterium]|nr:UDP-N-acetylmuramoyl-L-alanine--D-glutamate ligase [Coriobacteriia bacterium]